MSVNITVQRCVLFWKVSTLRTSHQREMQRIYAESAVQLSNTKFAELASKVDTQDVSCDRSYSVLIR